MLRDDRTLAAAHLGPLLSDECAMIWQIRLVDPVEAIDQLAEAAVAAAVEGEDEPGQVGQFGFDLLLRQGV